MELSATSRSISSAGQVSELQRHQDGAEKLHQLNGPFDAPSNAEETPARAARHVFHFDAAQGGQRADAVIQRGQSVARRNIAPGGGARARARYRTGSRRAAGRSKVDRAHAQPRAPARFRIPLQAVAAMFVENLREDLLLEFARLIQMPLRDRPPAMREVRELLRNRRAAAANPIPLVPAAPDSPVSRIKMQRSTRARCSQRSA